MIPRKLLPVLESRLFQGKALLLLGPRQVGKTTLMRELAARAAVPTLWLNADEPGVRSRLEQSSIASLSRIVGEARLVVLDEAQRIENIGLTLKLLVDEFPEVQVLATGSSALELRSTLHEPLTGRKFEYHLYPLSFEEMAAPEGLLAEEQKLELRLVYGYYPDIVLHPAQAEERLSNLSESYLYKDVLMLGGIKKPALLQKLLEALALQLGNEVSFREVGETIGADAVTVERYVDLLEKAFVLFRLPSLSRNRRNEIKRGKKVYFFDCGVRNSILQTFAPLRLRQDVGALWENFCVVERMKRDFNRLRRVNRFFWRTVDQQEIDFLEERDGKLSAFEFKWNRKAKARVPKGFLESYPGSDFRIITPENFSDWILEPDEPPRPIVG